MPVVMARHDGARAAAIQGQAVAPLAQLAHVVLQQGKNFRLEAEIRRAGKAHARVLHAQMLHLR